MDSVDHLAGQILSDIVSDFRAKNLAADALRREYIGLSLAPLKVKYCSDGSHSEVDFDLALKHLEEKKLVKTGPLEVYQSPPGAAMPIVGLYSKREFVYLTEDGYKAAQKTNTKRVSSNTNLHISGGTFHQSPIGFGNAVSQNVTFNIDSDSEIAESLLKLLSPQDAPSVEIARKNVVELVSTAKTGNLGEAKPIFVRLFEGAKDEIKQLAWSLITAYTTKQLGL
jgi:hypothetical protein